MAKQTDTLLLELRADISDLQSDLNKATRSIKGFGKQTTGSFGAITAAAKRMAGPLAAAFTITGLTRTVNQLVDAADSIGKSADKIGLSTTELQEWRYAAERNRVAANTLDMAVQRFTRRTAEAAQGTGEAKAALEELGIELLDTEGNLRRPEELLLDVADAMEKVESQGDRVRIAMRLFDSEGVAMVNVLRGGSSALREMKQELADVGGIIDEDLIRNTEELKNATAELDTAWRGFSSTLILEAAPAMASVTNWGTWLVQSIAGLKNLEKPQVLPDLALIEEEMRIRQEIARLEKMEAGNRSRWSAEYTAQHDARKAELRKELEAHLEQQTAEQLALKAKREEEEAAAKLADELRQLNEERAEAAKYIREFTAELLKEPLDLASQRRESFGGRLDLEYESQLQLLGAMEEVEDAFEGLDIFDRWSKQQIRAFNNMKSAIESGWEQLWVSLADSDMTGAERWKAIQNSILQAGLRTASELTIAWIMSEETRAMFTQANVAKVVVAMATEISARLSAAAAAIAQAIGSLFAWFASLGPWGIAAATASAAGLIATFAGLKSQLGFEKGGLFGKGQTAFLEGAGPELVAPVGDFFTAVAGLTGARERDLREGRSVGGSSGPSMVFNITAMSGADVQRAVERDVIPALKRARNRGRNW